MKAESFFVGYRETVCNPSPWRILERLSRPPWLATTMTPGHLDHCAVVVPVFLFFALAFFLDLSLGFKVGMPALQSSAYLAKNSPMTSGWTTVDSLILDDMRSLDLPFVALMRMGIGVSG